MILNLSAAFQQLRQMTPHIPAGSEINRDVAEPERLNERKHFMKQE
jgi:hypothetical protein